MPFMACFWYPKRIEVTGLNDERVITAVFNATLCSNFLLLQLVYQTDAIQSTKKLPEDQHITHSSNHSSNEETMTDYLNHVLFPYIDGVQTSCELSDDYPAVAFF